jgi:hypothetical protein
VKAKEILDDCIRSDIEDFYCEGESCSLLFLNPPYGDSLKNKYSDKSKRLETLFLRDTLQLLQYGGVLVFIVPLSSYSDAYLCELLITNFKEIRIWMAPDQTYKQTVLMAYRKHATPIGDNKDYKKQILIKDLQLMSRDALESDNPDDLFTSESKLLFGSEAKEEQKTGKLTQYIIPPTLKGEINYYKISLDIEHLMQDVLEQKQIRKRSSWDLPEIKVWTPCDPPLMPMTPWHVALSIASGQMNGLFRLNEETQILIKGQTFKSSVSKEKIEEIISDQKMSSKHIVEVVDVFKPCVMGLVFGGNNHGSIVHFE